MKQKITNVFLAWLFVSFLYAGCMTDDPKPTDVLQQYDRKTRQDTLSTKPLLRQKDSIRLDTSA